MRMQLPPYGSLLISLSRVRAFLIMREIPLTQGYFTQVDDGDFEWLSQWKWYATVKGTRVYAQRAFKHEKNNWGILLMHRAIMGVTDRKVLVDHEKGNGLNNQRANLRVCTNAQNMMNRGSDANSSSRFKGVSWSKSHKSWMASICIDKKRMSLGRFKNDEDAARAYNQKAKDHFGKFATFNDVDPMFPDGKLTPPVLRANNTSGFRGIALDKRDGKWCAQIRKDGKGGGIGRFFTAIEAAKAYDAKAIELFGRDARLNFPKPE